ncbi:hypothetical protein EDB92DRAFT_1832523, partial [Lactarius akahatsu]
LLLTSDPSPGWQPSAGLRVPSLAMNLQLYYNWEGLFQNGYDVDWESCGPQFMEHIPEHGVRDMWTCFVFGMRYIQPRVDHLRGKSLLIVHDIYPRRCLRESEEEREQIPMSPTHCSILKCAPLPESIQDPQNVDFMISEDGIVAREPCGQRIVHHEPRLIYLLTF